MTYRHLEFQLKMLRHISIEVSYPVNRRRRRFDVDPTLIQYQSRTRQFLLLACQCAVSAGARHAAHAAKALRLERESRAITKMPYKQNNSVFFLSRSAPCAVCCKWKFNIFISLDCGLRRVIILFSAKLRSKM